jgi:alpha-L-rhamnosidase
MRSSQVESQSNKLDTAVVRVRFEHLQEALGVGTPQPRVSWWVETSRPAWLQTAYAMELHAPSGELLGETGRVDSSDSVLVAWPFAPLASRQRVLVRVRVWDGDGAPSPWSELVPLEAGLLQPGDWTGKFVRPDWDEDPTQPQPGPLLRKAFTLDKDVRHARLYVTALGVYEATLNGKRVGDHVMPPGWTSYHHRLVYQTFDVTGLLRAGDNALGAMLGDGWFRGRLGFGGGRPAIYGDRIALLAQLEVEYVDGSSERITTDESWRARRGPIVVNDIYDGEEYDARLEATGWSEPAYDDGDWAGVKVVEWDFGTLVAPVGPPVRRTEFIEPKAIFQSPSGRTLIDFGQNLVGWLRLSVSGPAGQTITLRHAEVLEDGELGTRPLRHARATDRYTLRGSDTGAEEIWEPRFTFHGFRYAEVEGWPGELKNENITAVVCHSDMERTGWFECSDPLINRLHENVIWSTRGNFFSIPTDCPQRDERLGWTGDIQVFTPTASFLFDVAGFLTSWLSDLAAEQAEKGVVPVVVPDVMGRMAQPAAAWGDAAVVVPWVLYQRFGDEKLLSDHFASMSAWVDLVERVAGQDRLWDQGFQFGDWLDPAAPPDNPGAARTPGWIVATAYFARSAELVGRAARVLGREEEAEHYLALAAEVREAFNREYVTPAGRVLSDAATAYALALEFALLPEAGQREHAAERLVAVLRANGYRISTGFVGTPLICDALSSQGQVAAAFRLLTERDCPSWLYPVTMGATTIWERWDSMLPDGSINPGEMTSFNHYALGAVADWLHRVVAGLAPGEPGYRSLEFQPHPGGGLDRAAARHITPYGIAACSWSLSSGEMTVTVDLPPNTTARVTLPGQDAAPLEVGSGRHTWTYAYAVPEKERKPLSVDSTIGELIDDEQAFSRVKQALAKRGFDQVDRLLSHSDVSLRGVMRFLPSGPEVLAEVEQILAEVNRTD